MNRAASHRSWDAGGLADKGHPWLSLLLTFVCEIGDVSTRNALTTVSAKPRRLVPAFSFSLLDPVLETTDVDHRTGMIPRGILRPKMVDMTLQESWLAHGTAACLHMTTAILSEGYTGPGVQEPGAARRRV
ncbi:hypothetical protein BN1708_005849 [Verticillium longisporum]|uniref:Uncharacterized protein n=1 Tax=Verticillium longisporum TaxID=100787 RepID=A0A0G4ME68_VERLO|nr:hypothetical protein BN1708_005849 [Verticillium longisporum]